MAEHPDRNTRADAEVDGLYAPLRGRFGPDDPQANGYRYRGYFLAEQQLLLTLTNPAAQAVADVGCGSGLMAQPLLAAERLLIGVDYNRDACAAAAANGLAVLRGDAFHLPFAPASLDEIITCQFFNQQQPASVERFIAESAAALKTGGRLIMVWRNGTTLIHRAALAGLGVMDALRRRPRFPHYNHSLAEISEYGRRAGLTVERQLVSFPSLRWSSARVDGLLAKLIGASAIAVLHKARQAD